MKPGRAARIGALMTALATALVPVRAQGPATSSAPQPAVESLFVDATAKETAVRKALRDDDPAPTLLKAVRTVVSDYEGLVRRYPASAYCDDALWRAAKLSIDAFRKFGDEPEQSAALRLLQALKAGYPSSRYAKLARGELALLARLRPRTPATAESLPGAPAASAASPAAPIAPTPAKLARPRAGELATIKDIRRTVLSDVVRIIIELDREVRFHDERLEGPERVFVDLPSTQANMALIDHTLRFEDADLVRQVRIGRHPKNTTRVVLDADGISSYSVYPLYNPFRLVIDCLRAQPLASASALSPFGTTPRQALPTALAARSYPTSTGVLPVAAPVAAGALAEALLETPVPDLAAVPVTPIAVASLPSSPVGQPSRNLSGGFSIARQLGLGVSRIVIDPGHGGHDPGAKGGGTTEADLVLDVALRLEKLITAVPGMDAVLTRRTDEYIPLEERTAIANRENADLFLSIHVNASNNRQVRGIETYFLNFATNLGAAAVAARENAASGQSMAALPDVVKTIALDNKLDESRDFATHVQREMVAKLRPANRDVRDLGVKQAPFVVLIGAAMPSVLAEISFLTNAQETKLLKNSAYRQRIAAALFDAIRKYQSSLKNVSKIAQQP